MPISDRDPLPPPDPDDWFAEPGSAPTGARRPGPRTEPHDDGPPPSPVYGFLSERDFGRRGLIAAAVIVVLLILGGLALAGVFSSGGKKAATPPTTSPTTTTTPARTTTTAKPPATSSVPAPTASLKPGDQGAQVKVLQRALTQLGYSTGPVDGAYGPLTTEAVKSFQTASKLVADGVVGPLTLNALKQALQGSG